MISIIISSLVGTQFIPPPGLCQLEELGRLCGGRQPDDWEFEHRSRAPYRQKIARGSLVCQPVWLSKNNIIFSALLISHLDVYSHET